MLHYPFLDRYLEIFSIYNSWFANTRYLVFYEDFLKQGDEILLNLLEFMEEEPSYLEDFLNNKATYLTRLLDNYRIQHEYNSGGASSLGGSKPIHYSKNASFEILTYIDAYLEKADPSTYEKHLKRFQSFKEE